MIQWRQSCLHGNTSNPCLSALIIWFPSSTIATSRMISVNNDKELCSPFSGMSEIFLPWHPLFIDSCKYDEFGGTFAASSETKPLVSLVKRMFVQASCNECVMSCNELLWFVAKVGVIHKLTCRRFQGPSIWWSRLVQCKHPAWDILCN